MGRREREVTVTTDDADNRDRGKRYKLVEMPATQAEKWAIRAFLAMARNGVPIPDDLVNRGMAGIAAVGIRALGSMSFVDAEPLMDEMFGFVSFMPDASKPNFSRPLFEGDIEEVSTRLFLRKELLDLHVNFSKAASLLRSA